MAGFGTNISPTKILGSYIYRLRGKTKETVYIREDKKTHFKLWN